jgi:hypothetical protein
MRTAEICQEEDGLVKEALSLPPLEFVGQVLCVPPSRPPFPSLLPVKHPRPGRPLLGDAALCIEVLAEAARLVLYPPDILAETRLLPPRPEVRVLLPHRQLQQLSLLLLWLLLLAR